MGRVLIVDDDEALLFIMGEYLESAGIRFHLATSATQARRHLARFHYDLVISDLDMPGESGLELFRSVSPRHPGLNFILMSGNLNPGLRRQAMAMGVCNFVEKPFELAELKCLLTDSGLCELRAGIGWPAA